MVGQCAWDAGIWSLVGSDINEIPPGLRGILATLGRGAGLAARPAGSIPASLMVFWWLFKEFYCAYRHEFDE